jgi:hypothetical protein
VRGTNPSSLTAATVYEWQKVASSPHTWIAIGKTTAH